MDPRKKRQTEKQIDKRTNLYIEIQTDKRQTRKWTKNGQTDKWTQGHKDGQTDKQKQTNR